jgi:plastocyanin domain-containing protein
MAMSRHKRIDWPLLAWTLGALLVAGLCLAPLLAWWLLLASIGP